jgi:HAD superfamily phosphatase
MAEELIVFDMDGVLVDVSESYRETIVRTVEHFSGVTVTRAQIQDYKNQGGFNDDWKLSHHIIAEHGVAVEFQTVVDYFQGMFHGNGTDGLILRERWMARDGLFDRLAARFDSPSLPGACAGRRKSRCTASRRRCASIPSSAWKA